MATNSHIFVSSDDGNTYGVSTSNTINNADRLEMTYPLNGELAFAYDTLYIAHSAEDTVRNDALILSRPSVELADYLTAEANIQTAWTNPAERKSEAAAESALPPPRDGL